MTTVAGLHHKIYGYKNTVCIFYKKNNKLLLLTTNKHENFQEENIKEFINSKFQLKNLHQFNTFFQNIYIKHTNISYPNIKT